MRNNTQVYCVLDVKRDDIAATAIASVRRSITCNTLRKPLKVRMIDSFEDGVDHGGVQVELFAVLGKQFCNPALGFFTVDAESQLAWFWQDYQDPVDRFEIIGATVGLAVYNGNTIGVSFPLMLYMKLLGQKINQIDQIQDIYPSVANGLRKLLEYNGDVKDLGLSFDYTFEGLDGPVTIPMTADGDDKPVTNENKEEYVKEYIRYLAEVTVEPFFTAFKRGFNMLVPNQMIDMFSAMELKQLVQGTEIDDIDMTELRAVTKYDDGYSRDHEVIEWFWQVVTSFTADQKRNLLEFVTACARVPVVGGVSSLAFIIQRNGPDSDRLPTALTCFGRLLLPQYSSKQKLADMLTKAIENCKGFGLV
ncbi:hypothetical protein V1514DRAFT_283039 [Lipomyces japonicus]|uniref:uncharacterized protein n=1 Tax=Lipomyces japonicus TaxID=56871 RepID=UPI0034CD93E6